MTLDEAIRHAEEVAEYDCYNDEQKKCADEHRQLAEWLRELKWLREAAPDMDTIRRQMTLEKVYHLLGCTLIFKHNHNGIGLITVECMDMLIEMVTERRRGENHE